MIASNQSPSHYLNLSGTFRARSAEQTLEWLTPMLPALGITRIADITGLDILGIPVVTCIRPMAKHLSVSQGKGASRLLAKVSAIMEAIECYHMEHPPQAVLTGSYHQLKTSYPLANPEQFDQGMLVRQDRQQYVFDWIKADQLMQNEVIYLPRVLSDLDSTQMHSPYAWLNITSNGIAAGNTRDEAICHALYEVIERDSLYHWGQLAAAERLKQQLSLADLPDHHLQLIQQFHQANVPVKVWDITSNIGVPSFHCAIGDNEPMRNFGTFTGTGTHLSPSVALSRALTEAAQCRLTFISGNRDDVLPNFYQTRGIGQQTIGMQQIDAGKRYFANIVKPEITPSFRENWQQLGERLVANGYENIFLIDHTHAAFNIPVMQVIVPGLRFRAVRM